jgi:hypothetical protein
MAAQRRILFVGGGIVVALALAGGLALAAIPDANQQVQLCYKAGDVAKSGGAALSVIDAAGGGSCKSGDASLSLVQQGLVTGGLAGPGFSDSGMAPTLSPTVTVKTASATKLFVLGTFAISVTCASTSCDRNLQIFVDGNPVLTAGDAFPGSASGLTTRETLMGMVDVGAGMHTLTVEADNFGVLTSSNAITLGAIALGS